MRLGLIGIGGFSANYHIPHLLDRDDVEIAAVCDTSPETLDSRDERLRDCAEFADYRPLLDLDLDAVVVSSPNIYHYDQCQAALERDLHLLVDKPLTMTSAEAAALVELSHSRQRVLMTAYTRHFMASARHVRQYLASGATPQAITAVQRKNLEHRAPLHGGILHARTVHIVDLIPWLTRRPVIGVEGHIEYDTTGYESFVDMRLELAGGLVARLLCISGESQYQDEVSVYCAEQSFRIEQRQLFTSGHRGRWSELENLPECGNSTDHFLDALQGKVVAADSPTALDGQDGLQALRVIEAMVEAGRTGRFVTIGKN